MSIFGENVNNPGPKGGGLFGDSNDQKPRPTSFFRRSPLSTPAGQAPPPRVDLFSAHPYRNGPYQPPVPGRPSLFDGTPTSGGGPFGTGQPTAPAAHSLFGSTQPSSLFRDQARPGVGLFGRGYGPHAQPAPSLFGSTQSSTGVLFGGSQPDPSLCGQSSTQGRLHSSLHSNQGATINQLRQELEGEKKRSAQREGCKIAAAGSKKESFWTDACMVLDLDHSLYIGHVSALCRQSVNLSRLCHECLLTLTLDDGEILYCIFPIAL